MNRRVSGLVERIIQAADELRLEVHELPAGGRIVDLGVQAEGSLKAGRLLAEVCLAALGHVRFTSSTDSPATGVAVEVTTDQPVAACLASQYAGWRVSRGKYFAMGSGPMRAAAGREEIFDTLELREEVELAIGVLEAAKLPPDEVFEELAEACRVDRQSLTLLVAPTASQAGNVQIVARSVETALHKLHELKFDLSRIVSGHGTAPLPPVAADDLQGIGRTNDAILYGASVTLWVRGDDASLEEIGPRVPSSASSDHGRPFAEIFQHYEYDFYKIDPQLFSPAVIRLVNLDTGRAFRFGQHLPDVLARSFGMA
ncbi:MAG: methenyltetrahydromethanopterin cyclohydrolase [Pirellulales bacterium]|nr:methenyltetrahydromethanopterin cyclohydrolase [Pirellulales bacterium]